MSPPNARALAVALVAVLALGGCARRAQDSGFADVQKLVSDRGGYRLAWDTGSNADVRTAEAVRGLLSHGELSADDAVQVALLNNRSLKAIYEQLGVAQADLVQAGLLRNPVFDAEIKFAEGGGGTQLELAVVQEFLDVFQVPLRKRIARQSFEAAKLRVGGAVLDLAGRVRQAFYIYQGATQMVEMRQSVVEAAGVAHDFAQRLLKAGNITELQLARERAAHEQARLDLAAAESDVLATRERLNALMGLWGRDAVAWKAPLRLADVPGEEIDVAAVESRAIKRSIELAAARADVETTADTLGIRRAFALGGDVELGAAAEREPEGEWTVGPAVSVPIPLFDTGAARVSRAQAELRRARQAYAATAIEVRSAARAARDALLAARRRAEHLRTIILPLRHTIVEQTQAEYNAMLIGVFDVIRAKQDEIDAGATYVTALRDYWLARAGLEQVVNGRMGDAADVGTIGRQPSSRSQSGADGH